MITFGAWLSLDKSQAGAASSPQLLKLPPRRNRHRIPWETPDPTAPSQTLSPGGPAPTLPNPSGATAPSGGSQNSPHTGERGTEQVGQGELSPLPEKPPALLPCPSLGVLDEQAADEVLGQLAGVAEIFLIKVIVDSRDVGQGLLLCLPQERGGSAQPEEREGWDNPKRLQPEVGGSSCSPGPSRAAPYSQDVSDDPDAPGRERERRMKSQRAFGTRGDPPAQGDWLLEPWEGESLTTCQPPAPGVRSSQFLGL